jgi:hypothetical protein
MLNVVRKTLFTSQSSVALQTSVSSYQTDHWLISSVAFNAVPRDILQEDCFRGIRKGDGCIKIVTLTPRGFPSIKRTSEGRSSLVVTVVV